MIEEPDAVIEYGKVVDLDAHEQIARAADQDEWQWRSIDQDVLEGKHDGQVVLFPAHGVINDEPEIVASVADRAHIAANSPPVTLALIQRIRELEAAGCEIVDAPNRYQQDGCVAVMRTLLDKGVVLP